MHGVTKNAPNKHTLGYNEGSSGTSTTGMPYTESKRNLTRQGRDGILRPHWSMVTPLR